MDILFGRHGNTFGPGSKTVWVGRETDMDLVDKGWQQARAFGSALSRLSILPDRVYCASLKRTLGFAQAMGDVQVSGSQLTVDHRLDEIDYGCWAGKSNDDINSTPEGAAALKDWTAHDHWPATAGWVSTKAEIFGNIQSFIDEILFTADPEHRILVISSNGVLRFFPRLLQVTNQVMPSYVMKTGHIGMISGIPGNFRVRFWNIDPDTLTSDYLT